MNIPLNIDWQQILLHLLNFSILTFGLYLLLYNPIKNFMEERTGYYNKLDNEALEKLTQAEDLKISYEERLGDMEKEIEGRKAHAAKEAKEAADKLLKNAKEQARKLLSDAKESAQQERIKILEDAQQEITHIAISATEKLLTQSSSEALDQFLDVVKKE
ncbi:MAG TPA: ATP synthase F0 subunit B [Clostridium sp.]|jgi:F-type H+-transporting ATPase subunit b|nr:ATP synthase F0 subunit B [Clostridium sp.]